MKCHSHGAGVLVTPEEGLFNTTLADGAKPPSPLGARSFHDFIEAVVHNDLNGGASHCAGLGPTV